MAVVEKNSFFCFFSLTLSKFTSHSLFYFFLLSKPPPLLASHAALSTSDLENSPISLPALSTTGRRRTLRASSVLAAASAASPPRTTSGSGVITSLTEAAAPFEAATWALKKEAQSPPGAGKMPLGATSGMSRERRSKSETTPIWVSFLIFDEGKKRGKMKTVSGLVPLLLSAKQNSKTATNTHHDAVAVDDGKARDALADEEVERC